MHKYKYHKFSYLFRISVSTRHYLSLEKDNELFIPSTSLIGKKEEEGGGRGGQGGEKEEEEGGGGGGGRRKRMRYRIFYSGRPLMSLGYQDILPRL